MHNNMSMVIDKIRTSFSKQVNLFKKGLGVGVPGNQHDNTYAQRKIQRQILVWPITIFSVILLLNPHVTVLECKILS